MCRNRNGRKLIRRKAQALPGWAGVVALAVFPLALLITRCDGRTIKERSLLVISTIVPSSPVSAPVSAPEPTRGDGGDGLGGIWWVFVVVPAFFISFLLLTIVCFKFHVEKKRTKTESKEIFFSKYPWKSGLSRSMRQRLKEVTVRPEVPQNTREDLEHECEEFSNIIGTSVDCVLFKGTRDSGAQIAVARVRIPASRWTAHCELLFLQKLQDLTRMTHPNIVNLLAYCSQDEPFERMLIFEYVPNGSVYDHLHSEDSPADVLDWRTRLKILMGAAYGLNYMLTELDSPVVPLKLDANSVYLTESFCAKVAPFGMSRISVGTRESNSLGRRESFGEVVKSMGYTDWEKYRNFAKPEHVIYSFGLFVLELISGRSGYDPQQGQILQWASQHMDSPLTYWHLVDPALTSHDCGQLAALVDVVKHCTHPKTSRRPSMARVTDMLAAASKISLEDASAGSSGKIDYKSSPLTWAKLELLTAESPQGSEEDDQMQLSLSTLPLLAEPSSPKASPRFDSYTVPVASTPQSSSSNSGGDLSDSLPADDVSITVTSSQVKQFHQSDSKSFER